MQFLFGGYSLGHPGLVMEPFSLVMKPPQAAGRKMEKGGNKTSVTLPSVRQNETKNFLPVKIFFKLSLHPVASKSPSPDCSRLK